MHLELTTVFRDLGIALGLGLLVGLQRESVASKVAGFRTFPLVTILGAFCAMLANVYGGWILAGGFLGVTLMAIISNVALLQAGEVAPGLTTEFALLLMFGVGAYVVVGYPQVAIVVGAGVAVLLQMKESMHGVASKLGPADLTAIMRFALISLVILPALPNETFGPYHVLNPREIWLMVVLIVGISLTAYIAYKFFGQHAGVILAGILGGLIKSELTTVSYSRRTKESDSGLTMSAIVIMIASAIVMMRVLFEIGLIAPSFFPTAAVPLSAFFAVMIAMSLVLWLRRNRTEHTMPDLGNPTQLRPALIFAALYAMVLLAVAAARSYYGNHGLYLVSAISGFSGLDAITLSTSRMVVANRLDEDVAWRLILVAAVTNLGFKTLLVAIFGSRRLLVVLSMLYGVAAAAGIALVVFGARAGL